MYELHRADPLEEVNSHSACQISHLLRNKNVCRHVHTSPTTCTYPQPPESRPHFHIHIPHDPFQMILPSTLRFHMWSVPDLQVFQLCGLHLSPT
jgi:hypothetical protein